MGLKDRLEGYYCSTNCKHDEDTNSRDRQHTCAPTRIRGGTRIARHGRRRRLTRHGKTRGRMTRCIRYNSSLCPDIRNDILKGIIPEEID